MQALPQRVKRSPVFSERRNGFTLIELITVTLVILMLVALILPAVMNARLTARRLQCGNNLRNVAFAILQEMELKERFPASGNYSQDPVSGNAQNQFSWVVSVLPHLEQGPLAVQWNKDKPMEDPVNEPLTHNFISVLTCPDDISVAYQGDLSYVVNGGLGFTVKNSNGVRDCPVDKTLTKLDLNGDGICCDLPSVVEKKPTDRDMYVHFGVFFLETWKWDVSRRSHRPATIFDGMTYTYMLSENIRAGYDPNSPSDGHWASPLANRHSFFIGNPCDKHDCTTGPVDYSLSNSGDDAINSGIKSAEGNSPVPNSFHKGGVNMAFCDGRVLFLSEDIDGGVYAANASPQGTRLVGTRFEQPLITE